MPYFTAPTPTPTIGEYVISRYKEKSICLTQLYPRKLKRTRYQ